MLHFMTVRLSICVLPDHKFSRHLYSRCPSLSFTHRAHLINTCYKMNGNNESITRTDSAPGAFDLRYTGGRGQQKMRQ